LDIGEGAAVADRVDPRAGRIVKPEELSDSDAIQALALLGAVPPSPICDTVHHCLRDQHPGIRDGIEDLVSVEIVALTDAKWRSLLGLEVKARVDLVLTVGEVEAHLRTAWQSHRWPRIDR
jgi:hypothetical protein